MFAPISNISLSVDNENYVVSLGYILPDDISVEEIKEKPEFCYILQKEAAEGKLEMLPPPEEGKEPDEVFLKLDSTAKIYAKGFIDGVSYYNAVYNQPTAANDNKIITSK